MAGLGAAAVANDQAGVEPATEVIDGRTLALVAEAQADRDDGALHDYLLLAPGVGTFRDTPTASRAWLTARATVEVAPASRRSLSRPPRSMRPSATPMVEAISSQMPAGSSRCRTFCPSSCV